MISWISMSENCERVRLKFTFCCQTVSAEILSCAEIFCKATNHVGAQIIAHYARNNAFIYFSIERYAPFLQLTQV